MYTLYISEFRQCIPNESKLSKSQEWTMVSIFNVIIFNHMYHVCLCVDMYS